VRVQVEWSDAGEAAVQGRRFRRFSPTFHVDEAGHVIGSEINMGGLVNRAAFQSIAAIAARSAGHDRVKVLRDLVSADGRESLDELIDRACQRLTELRRAEEQRTVELDRQRATEAASFVGEAIRAGRLPAENEAVHAFWRRSYQESPDSARVALQAQPVRTDLLQSVTRSDVTPGDRESQQQAILAQLAIKKPALSFDRRFQLAREQHPDLFRDAHPVGENTSNLSQATRR
jgi:phage I-like protein